MTRRVEAIGILALVAVFIVSLLIVNHDAFERGATNEKLKANAAATAAQNVETRRDSLRDVQLTRAADSAVKAAAVVHTVYVAARSEVHLKGDTVITASGPVVLPDVAKLITACDINLAADSVSIHALIVNRQAQDTLIASLYAGIKLRDERIALLEREKRPRFGVKTGIVIGAVVAVVASKPAAVFAGIVHALKQVQH